MESGKICELCISNHGFGLRGSRCFACLFLLLFLPSTANKQQEKDQDNRRVLPELNQEVEPRKVKLEGDGVLHITCRNGVDDVLAPVQHGVEDVALG